MRRISFEGTSFDDFNTWATADKKLYQRIARLLDEVRRTPFDGIGKPEALKGDLHGCWSRRITDEHRLVYQVTDAEIIVISCKTHYSV